MNTETRNFATNITRSSQSKISFKNMAELTVKCDICLKRDDILKMGFIPSCGHGFHPKSIGRWSSQENTCPTCRKQRRVFKLVKFRPDSPTISGVTPKQQPDATKAQRESRNREAAVALRIQLAAAASEYTENSSSSPSEENEASNDELDHGGQALDGRTSQEDHVVNPGAAGSQVVVAKEADVIRTQQFSQMV